MGRSGRLVYRGRRVGSVWVCLALMQQLHVTPTMIVTMLLRLQLGASSIARQQLVMTTFPTHNALHCSDYYSITQLAIVNSAPTGGREWSRSFCLRMSSINSRGPISMKFSEQTAIGTRKSHGLMVELIPMILQIPDKDWSVSPDYYIRLTLKIFYSP